jgi:hypothetical protein
MPLGQCKAYEFNPAMPWDKRQVMMPSDLLLRPPFTTPNSCYGEGVIRRHCQSDLVIDVFPKILIKKGRAYEKKPWETVLPEDLDSSRAGRLYAAIELLIDYNPDRVGRFNIETSVVEVDVPSPFLLIGQDPVTGSFYQVTHLGKKRQVIYVTRQFLERCSIQDLATVLNHDLAELELYTARFLDGDWGITLPDEEKIHSEAMRDEAFPGAYAQLDKFISSLRTQNACSTAELLNQTKAELRLRVGELEHLEGVYRQNIYHEIRQRYAREVQEKVAGELFHRIKREDLGRLSYLYRATRVFHELRTTIVELGESYIKYGYLLECEGQRDVSENFYRNGLKKLAELRDVDVGIWPISIQMKIVLLAAKVRLLDHLVKEMELLRTYGFVEDEDDREIHTYRLIWDANFQHVKQAVRQMLEHHLVEALGTPLENRIKNAIAHMDHYSKEGVNHRVT